MELAEKGRQWSQEVFPTFSNDQDSLHPGLGRSGREGIGYPHQYSWASLVAQVVKNWPAMWDTWVQSLGWEDPPEKGMASPLQYSGLENSMDSSWGCKDPQLQSAPDTGRLGSMGLF